MNIDVWLLAELNLTIQMILALMLLIASRLAVAGDSKKHCTIMRIAVPVQILAVLGVMLPSMYAYLRNTSPGQLFNSEIIIHHTLGLGVLILWIYINLIFMRVIRPGIKIRTVMRLALVFWAASIVIGLHLYWLAYLT